MKEKLLKYFIDHARDEWFFKYYGSLFFPIFAQGSFAVARANEIWPNLAMPHGLFFQNWAGDREFRWLWRVQEMEYTRRKLYLELKKNLNFSEQFLNQYKAGFDIFSKEAKVQEKVKLANLNNIQIVENLLKLITAAGMQGVGYIADSLLVASDEDWFRKFAEEFSGGQLDDTQIKILKAPTQRTFVNEVELLVLQAACTKSEGKIIEKNIDKLVKNYYWVENNYLKAKPKTKHEFSKEIQTTEDPCSKFYQEIARLEKNKKVKENIISRVKNPEKLKAFVEFADNFTKIQDLRKQVVLRLNHFIFLYLPELAKRIDFDPELIFYVIHPELEDFVKNPDKYFDIAKKRQQGCLVIHAKSDWAIFFRDELAGIDLSHIYKDYSQITEVKGMPASPGKASGQAKVILGSDQFSVLKRGDILVTNQTTPDFVPLMKKAGAVVAEQGGITSHAAIVSRELGIPCVVGVKDAMSIFKDETQVEVDAGKGVVRKIT